MYWSTNIFFHHFHKGKLPWPKPYQNGLQASREEHAPRNANSFLQEFTPNGKDNKMKLAELIPLKMYPFILNSFIREVLLKSHKMYKNFNYPSQKNFSLPSALINVKTTWNKTIQDTQENKRSKPTVIPYRRKIQFR